MLDETDRKMNITNINSVLHEYGYRTEVHGEKLQVKFGWPYNELTISWDLSRQQLSFSYHQFSVSLLAIIFCSLAVHSIISGDVIAAVLQSAITISFVLATIITELKVIELRNFLVQSGVKFGYAAFNSEP